MTLIDSSGWIEFATGSPLAGRYEIYLRNPEKLVTPSIVVYEVYKRLKRDGSEAVADAIVALMGKTEIVPMDTDLAIRAADVSLLHGLAMVDAVVYATALTMNADLVTSDADFKHLPHVVYLKK